MGIALLVPVLAYLAVVVFAAGVALRAAKYARAPMHLRWELYPVPHEKGRAYGGSYFEEVDWWSRPRETSRTAEILAMLEEMVLIRSLWRHNRPQWYASFPFHFGLYLLIGFIVLMAATAGAELALGKGHPAATVLGWACVVAGVTGLALASLGTLLLLARRCTNPVLRSASTPLDYFNLTFLLVVFSVAALAWVTVDPAFGSLRTYLASLLTLSLSPAPHPLIGAEVTLVSLFMIYLPFTHMTHFVAKYFTYHQVRWDDRPNLGESGMRAKMMSNLSRPVGWSAPHIKGDKSWAEASTEVD